MNCDEALFCFLLLTFLVFLPVVPLKFRAEKYYFEVRLD